MRRPGPAAAGCGHYSQAALRHEKMAALCGAAKFREETSKKADSAARPHCCGAQSSPPDVRARAIFCNAAFQIREWGRAIPAVGRTDEGPCQPRRASPANAAPRRMRGGDGKTGLCANQARQGGVSTTLTARRFHPQTWQVAAGLCLDQHGIHSAMR